MLDVNKGRLHALIFRHHEYARKYNPDCNKYGFICDKDKQGQTTMHSRVELFHPYVTKNNKAFMQ